MLYLNDKMICTLYNGTYIGVGIVITLLCILSWPGDGGGWDVDNCWKCCLVGNSGSLSDRDGNDSK